MGGSASVDKKSVNEGNGDDETVSSLISEIKLIEKVEKFVTLGFNNFSPIECLRLLLSSELGQRQFKLFLKKGLVEIWFTFLERLVRIKQKNEESEMEFKELSNKLNEILNEALVTGSSLSFCLRNNFREKITALTLDLLPLNELNEFIDSLINIILKEMSEHFLPSFYESRYYKSWRLMEKCHSTAITSEDTVSIKDSTDISFFEDFKRDSIYLILSPINTTSSFVYKLLQSDEGRLIEKRCDWLMTLLSTVDILPFGFFLSKSDETNKIPIIFTNQKFDKLMNLSFDSVKGKSLSNLCTGDDQTMKCLAVAQIMGKKYVEQLNIPSIDNINNKKSVVGLKPLYDNDGNFQYLLGILVEVESDLEAEYQKQLISKMLKTLPDCIVCGINE